jgi:hypothetical protein
MKIRERLVSGAVRPELKARNCEAVCEELLRAFQGAGALKEHQVCPALAKLHLNEKCERSVLTTGAALLCTSISELSDTFATVGVSQEGVLFAGCDKPVHVIALVLGDADRPGLFQQAVQAARDALSSEDVVLALVRAENVGQIFDAFQELNS